MKKENPFSRKYRVDTLRLKSIIILRGHSLSSFAKVCGISSSSLYHIFQGRSPTCRMMCRIVNGLNLTSAEAIDIFFAPILPVT